jgi:hypothetical protein
METPDNLIKYAGYFVGFTIILVIGVSVLAQIAPTSTNESSGGVIDQNSMFATIGQYSGLISVGAVIFGAVLVLKAFGTF